MFYCMFFFFFKLLPDCSLKAVRFILGEYDSEPRGSKGNKTSNEPNLMSLLSPFSERVPDFTWIGLNDMVEEGMFFWVDGTKPVYTK